MSKRLLLAGASALMLALAVPAVSMTQVATAATMPYSVAAVQQALNDLGYSAGPVDGLMGGKTRGAIRAYQTDKGLPASGEASRSLYYHLQRSLGVAEQPALEPGLDSAQISDIQARLRDRGYTVPYISGSLDSATVAAIRAYQTDAGLPATGRASAWLYDQLRIGITTSGGEKLLNRSEIVRLQAALNARGYSAGPEDGVAGPKVRAAIRTYQADAGLPTTGEATRSLLAKLESSAEAGDDDDATDDASSSSNLIAQIENQLQRRGYYVGDVDGVMDGQLRATIRTYQRHADLSANGEASEALLQSLKTSLVRNRSETNSLLVWEIENQLERLGYAVGMIDGTVDNQARLAITTYQTAARIRNDGRVSFALLDHIEQANARNESETGSLLIWNIEMKLKQRGYKIGPHDGTMDAQTEAAIGQYEQDNGLAVTGKATADVLASLESSEARTVTRRDIREIERRLNRRGYVVSEVDGIVNSQTVKAIKAYQQDAGLVVNGRPSGALLQHLRSSSTVSSSYNSSDDTVQELIDALRHTVEQGSSN